MKLSDENIDKLAFLKLSASEEKSRLIDLMRAIEEISPKEADELGAIIGRLEAWQHRSPKRKP